MNGGCRLAESTYGLLHRKHFHKCRQ
jgi:hypothetical protein